MSVAALVRKQVPYFLSRRIYFFFALDKSHRSQDVCFPCGDRVDNTAHRQTYAYVQLAPLAIKLASRTLREKHKSFRSLNIKYIPPQKTFCHFAVSLRERAPHDFLVLFDILAVLLIKAYLNEKKSFHNLLLNAGFSAPLFCILVQRCKVL